MAAFVRRWKLSLLLEFPSYEGKQPVDTFSLMLISNSLPTKLLGDTPRKVAIQSCPPWKTAPVRVPLWSPGLRPPLIEDKVDGLLHSLMLPLVWVLVVVNVEEELLLLLVLSEGSESSESSLQSTAGSLRLSLRHQY